MKRRSFIVGAAALAASIGLGAAFWQAAQPPASYPHMTLDSSTLATRPDTAETIKTAIASEPFKGLPVAVEFVAGWCPHCARLKPEMDKALKARAAAGHPLGLLSVVVQEGDYRTGERGAFGYVRAFRQMTKEPAFPQIQIWQNERNKGFFIGERSAAEISSFIDKTLAAPQGGLAPARKPA